MQKSLEGLEGCGQKFHKGNSVAVMWVGHNSRGVWRELRKAV